jgi:RND family efflux transporter MFP subunit
VAVDAFPGKTFTGTVDDLFPTASTTSRVFSVRVTIPNGGQLLRPGMYARGNVVVEKRQGIVVPKDAVVSSADASQSSVYVVENGTKAIKRPVKVGIQTRTTSEILSGLQAGDEVIVNGQDGLADGSKVQVEKTAAGAQEASAR